MSGRLRILVYAPHFAEYALRMAEALGRDADVLLVCERRNLAGECPPALVARARRTIEIETFDGSAGFPAGPWTRHVRLPWLVSRFRPDVAHVQEQADAPTARLLERLARRVPVALTVHDPGPHSGNDATYAARGKAFRERLRAGAAAYQVHGAYCERELRASRRVDRPLISTAMGVHFVPEPEAERPREPGTLLFFGRMEAYKGLETLLDACDILRAQKIAFRLIVAGRGPEAERLAARLAAPDIELHARFIGHDEAIALFQRASLVVAPYHDATQSAVVASAFGNARPVVVSRVGGLPDSVADGGDGVLVRPDDPRALAAALAPLLSDDARVAALQAGVREKVRRELEWPRIAGQLEAFYRELIAARGAPVATDALPRAEAQRG